MTASARGGYTGERLSRSTGGGAGVQQPSWQNFASAVERQTTADGVYDTAVARTHAVSVLGALGSRRGRVRTLPGYRCPGLEGSASRRREVPPRPRPVALVFARPPVAGRVVEASPGRPCLAVRIALDPPWPRSPGRRRDRPAARLARARARREPGRAAAPGRRYSPRGPPRLPPGRRAAGAAGAPRDHLPRPHKPARVAAAPDRLGRPPRPSGSPRDPLAEGPLRGAAPDRVAREST